jgi:hypothetical protein
MTYKLSGKDVVKQFNQFMHDQALRPTRQFCIRSTLRNNGNYRIRASKRLFYPPLDFVFTGLNPKYDPAKVFVWLHATVKKARDLGYIVPDKNNPNHDDMRELESLEL